MGIFSSKTFWGAVLGLAYLAIQVVGVWPEAPPSLINLLGLVATFLTTLGLWDSATQSGKSIIMLVKDFVASKPGIGVVVLVLVTIADEIVKGMIAVPPWVVPIADAFGILITVLGLRSANAAGRQNLSPVAPQMVEKYKV
jgi:hypothetical protein